MANDHHMDFAFSMKKTYKMVLTRAHICIKETTRVSNFNVK